jgi:hypothetical protein
MKLNLNYLIYLNNYAECRYAECRYTECHNAERRYAECRYTECRNAECHNAERRYAECHGSPENDQSDCCFSCIGVKRLYFCTVRCLSRNQCHKTSFICNLHFLVLS